MIDRQEIHTVMGLTIQISVVSFEEEWTVAVWLAASERTAVYIHSHVILSWLWPYVAYERWPHMFFDTSFFDTGQDVPSLWVQGTFDCSDQWGIVEIYYAGSRSSLKRIDNFQLGF